MISFKFKALTSGAGGGGCDFGFMPNCFKFRS